MRGKEIRMEVLYSRCAGLDVHKDTVVACIRVHQGSQVELKVRTFGTTTKALLELSDWLTEYGVTHVAMEATGVYWKPVWHVLDGTFELVLANAKHIKNVPGRKTDVNDAQWIADLLAHGLIQGSFVPPTSIQDMRTMMRTRKQLVRERTGHVQRIQKTLEDANIKIASVISDVTGVSGRAILRAIIEGRTNPHDLLAVTTGRLKASESELQEAMRGRIRTPHRFLLKLHLEQIEGLEKSIADVDTEVGALLEPFRAKCQRLTTIPGVSDVVAEVILSEIGIDMSRFPTPANLISWSGFCPRNDESAGKRRSTRLRMGAPWLKTTMVQAAWAAVRSKSGYLPAQFHRIKSRRGPKKAIIAVAASMLTAAYFIIRDDVEYRELGSDHFQRTLDRDKAASRLVKRLNNLGFNVEIKAAA
jgi:transposase